MYSCIHFIRLFKLPTVQVVDFEEEDELLVRTGPRELVHRVDELGHRDRPVAVAVEDAEGALHEERLQIDSRVGFSGGLSFFLVLIISWCLRRASH